MENTNSKKELYAALAKAQGLYSMAKKNRKGYNYVYADMNSLVTATRKALSENGLAVISTTIPSGDSGDTKKPMILRTLLVHSSGQCIESNVNIVFNDSAQGAKRNVLQLLGTSLSYLERYAYKGITGVVIEGDGVDNDEV